MNATELLILNLEEVRRRSVKIWRAIPDDRLHWKPDVQAMSCIEMVRHVLEAEYHYTLMLKSGGSLASDESPFAELAFSNVEAEIEFSAPYHRDLLDLVKSYQPEDLSLKTIDRFDKGYVRTLSDFILRMAYHESVHAGQMLGYLRQMNAPRPNVWD